MRYFVILISLLLVFNTVDGQQKKKGKVNRKYRQAEQVNPNLPATFFRGQVRDLEKNPLPGAHVTVEGLKVGVHTNEDGYFLLKNLPAGRVRIVVSFLGYEPKSVDYILQEGQNYHNITLREKPFHVDPVTVVAQNRAQQILDVPTAINALNADFTGQLDLTELRPLAAFVPGLYIREQGANRPTFSIRGITSDEVSPSAQPRISVFFNHVPVSRASGASLSLFDMDRVEVLKGPQNTLFGRGAQMGAIHFIPEKPTNRFGGYISAGGGDYNQREIRGAVNVPLIEDMLFVRAAGIYDARDGYVENTFGGTLNGKNTLGGRFSLRFLPAFNHKIDLVLNMQKDETPGIAFMSRLFPNSRGEYGVFDTDASLEQGRNLGTGKDLFNAMLTWQFYKSENTSWTTVSSFRKAGSYARWDGDGTAAPAIFMMEDAGSEQLYQEVRYNFSRNSRLNGSGGVSYWREKARQTYGFSPNEQNMFHLFFDPAGLVMLNGQPVAVPALPDIPELGPLGGMPLPENHEEENRSHATNQAAEAFVDGTWQLTRRIFLNGGLRAVYDRFNLSSEAEFTGGDPSVLGNLTGNAPNLFFRPSEMQSIQKSALSFTWRGGFQYRFSGKANFFANYSRGRRPHVLQFTSTGEPEVLDPEIITNYEAGLKFAVLQKVYVNAVGFYQDYNDFQTRAWVADTETGEFNYKVKDGGQATSYGAETTLRMALSRGIDLFGNYAWLHARFDPTDADGLEQEYAGNTFRLSPEHSFAIGFTARAKISSNIDFFATPAYQYQTHIYFEDANTEGLEQPAYGLLRARAGFELREPEITLSINGSNLLGEDFLTSAGNTGSLFGVPTFVPGPPRMMGAQVTWKF